MSQGPSVQASRQQTISSHNAAKMVGGVTEAQPVLLDLIDNRTGARVVKSFANEANAKQFFISADAANFTLQYERVAGSF